MFFVVGFVVVGGVDDIVSFPNVDEPRSSEEAAKSTYFLSCLLCSQ
jgi:hypothetical protein